MRTETTITAAKMQSDLRSLYLERTFAELEGLDADGGYMADLLDDIASLRHAYAGAVVTEIAVLRAQLGGSLQG